MVMTRENPRQRRERIERPYRHDHEASARKRAFRPVYFRDRLSDFLRAWRDETPTDIHGSGVEWEKPGRIVRGDGTGVTDPGGGNALGAPRLRPDFRAFVEGLDSRTEHATSGGQVEMTESYATPTRWAVRFMERSSRPLLAKVLRWIGYTGDYRGITVTCGTCTSAVGLPAEYEEAIGRDAISLFWQYYEDAPRPRT